MYIYIHIYTHIYTYNVCTNATHLLDSYHVIHVHLQPELLHDECVPQSTGIVRVLNAIFHHSLCDAIAVFPSILLCDIAYHLTITVDILLLLL